MSNIRTGDINSILDYLSEYDKESEAVNTENNTVNKNIVRPKVSKEAMLAKYSLFDDSSDTEESETSLINEDDDFEFINDLQQQGKEKTEIDIETHKKSHEEQVQNAIKALENMNIPEDDEEDDSIEEGTNIEDVELDFEDDDEEMEDTDEDEEDFLDSDEDDDEFEGEYFIDDDDEENDEETSNDNKVTTGNVGNSVNQKSESTMNKSNLHEDDDDLDLEFDDDDEEDDEDSEDEDWGDWDDDDDSDEDEDEPEDDEDEPEDDDDDFSIEFDDDDEEDNTEEKSVANTIRNTESNVENKSTKEQNVEASENYDKQIAEDEANIRKKQRLLELKQQEAELDRQLRELDAKNEASDISKSIDRKEKELEKQEGRKTKAEADALRDIDARLDAINKKHKDEEIEFDPYAKYTAMNVDKLYLLVRKFMIENGVRQNYVSIDLLNSKFGANNIKNLIKKDYLIKTRKGVTAGKC